MVVRLRAWLPWSAGLFLTIAGCQSMSPAPQPHARGSSPRNLSRPWEVQPVTRGSDNATPEARTDIMPVSFVQTEQPKEQPKEDKPPMRTPLGERLQLPPDLPGRSAPIITLPELKPGNEAARKEAIDRHFPALPSLPELLKPQMGTDGKPLSLADLQHAALSYNPQIRQAN